MCHPDDAEFGVGGTVPQWVQDGWQVVYVICADGSGGGPDDATDVGPETRAQTVATRQREQRAAAELLGVREVRFLNYPDGRIQPSLELRCDLVRMLRTYRPQRVICMSPDRQWAPVLSLPRYHPDHLAVGQASVAALYPACQNPWDFPELLEEGLKPHRVSEIYISLAPLANTFVDITPTIDLKMRAVRAHVSQQPDPDAVERMLRGYAAEVGKKYGVAYAEEFHVIKM